MTSEIENVNETAEISVEEWVKRVAYHMRRIRRLREIPQSAIAKRLKISQPTLSEWEHGKKDPGIAVMKQLAVILGVSVEAFLQPIPTTLEEQVSQ